MHNRLSLDWGIIVKVMNIWDDSAAVFGAAESKCHWFWSKAGHTLDDHRVLTDWKKNNKKNQNVGDQRHEDSFNRFLNCVILLSVHTGRSDQNTKPHNPQSTAVIPQTHDLRHSLVIKPDFSGDTNMEGLQRRQLTPLCLTTMRKKQIGIWVKSWLVQMP